MADNNYSLITSEMGKKLSNWDKPGGTLGLVVATIIGIGIAVGLYKILPFLITMTQNIITLVLLVAVLVGIGLVLASKSFRENVSMAYFILMRKIAGILIETDPIAIVRKHIQDMRDKIALIREQMGKVNGLIQLNQRRVETKTNELEDEIIKLAEFNKRNDPKSKKAKIVCERQVDRLKAAIENAKKRLADSKQWYEVLKELRDYAELDVQDTENEVQARQEEYESMKAQHAAFSSIMSILKGNPNKMVNFTRAMDYMAQDVAFRVGEMSSIISETGGLLAQKEIDDAITSTKAAEILKRYEEGGIESLFSKSTEVKAIEGKRTDYNITFDGGEERTPVMVERQQEEKPVEQTKFFG